MALRRLLTLVGCVLTSSPFFASQSPASGAHVKQILLIADRPSHGPLEHEHNAAAWLLQKWLNGVAGVRAAASFNGWPEDPASLETADAIFLFCTGGERHEAFQENRPQALQKAVARGAGLMFHHYCVEPPATSGHKEMLDWIGGYFELNYSVNPVWDADFKTLPDHPIARGVVPFHIRDEWYYNMRFADGMRGVTPILTAIPGADTLSRPDGEHSGNPDVRAKLGEPTVVMWAFTRPDGGRGVGFTGGHDHMNFADPNFRKLVLNALLWIAKVDVPPQGVNVTVTDEELREHVDPKPPRKPPQMP